MQNIDQTAQNVSRAMQNVGFNMLYVSQGPKGEGAECAPKAPGSPPSPIHEKTLMSRNDF